MFGLFATIVESALSVLNILWKNSWGRVLIIAMIAFAAGFYESYKFASKRIDSLKAAHAIELVNRLRERDNEWQSKLSEANAVHERELAAAIEAANNVPEISTDADLEKLCKGDSNCRDR